MMNFSWNPAGVLFNGVESTRLLCSYTSGNSNVQSASCLQ